MKQPAFLKIFATEAAATEYARMKNQANRMARWLWVIVEGPADAQLDRAAVF